MAVTKKSFADEREGKNVGGINGVGIVVPCYYG